MFPHRHIRACALLSAFLLHAHAQAGDTTLATNPGQAVYGAWNSFNVSDLDALSLGTEWIDNNDSASPTFGTPLTFSFTVDAGHRATLTVVDAGFAGDTFTVTNFGATLGATSAVPAATYDPNGAAIVDFDAALADPAFSRGTFQLDAGSYRIGGLLAQSVTDAGVPLNATLGGLRLTVSAVPEPATWLSMVAGITLLATALRRRRRD